MYKQVPHSDGSTAVALRGRARPVTTSGTLRSVLPTTRVATQTVAPGHDYHFTLPAGGYVLDVTRDSKYARRTPPLGYVAVTVSASATVKASIPNTRMGRRAASPAAAGHQPCSPRSDWSRTWG